MEQGAQGGTVVEIGSQTSKTAEVGQNLGAEGAGTAPEPTVEIDGQQVPLSVAKNALKVNASFTETSQRLAEDKRALAAKEAEIQQKELAMSSLAGLATALSNPDVAQRIAEVAPEVVQAMPRPEATANTALLAENLQMKFENYIKTSDLTPEEADGVRAEMFNLASKGDLAAAQKFDDIGLRLYSDSIISRRAEALANKQREEEAQRRAAGTVGQSVAQIPSGNNLNGLRGEALIAAAHAQNSKRK